MREKVILVTKKDFSSAKKLEPSAILFGQIERIRPMPTMAYVCIGIFVKPNCAIVDSADQLP